MKQRYYHYTEWEDWKNGMYKNVLRSEKEPLVIKAKKLLSDPVQLFHAMLAVISEWKKSSEVNMTNLGENRRAWLGQAACTHAHGIPEDLTREAWNTLESNIQSKANEVANQVIKIWEGRNLERMENGDQLCLRYPWE